MRPRPSATSDRSDDRPAEERYGLDATRITADHPLSDADAFSPAHVISADSALWTGEPEFLRGGAAWRWRDLRHET